MPYKDPEKGRSNSKKYYYENLDKIKAYHIVYYKENKEKRIKYNLKKSFDLSLEKYNELFTSQKGLCSICGKHQKDVTRRFAVDHCHTTGKIRSLLCQSCNTHLGIYEKHKDKFETYLIKMENV